MTTVPTVSVVIAAYDEARWIGACLASLRAQTHRDFEVIVVDDGSTDATAEIAERAGARVVRTPHRGVAAARNAGAAQAHGRILVFVDADDIYAPDFLERLTAPLATGGGPGGEPVGATFPGGVEWHNPDEGLAGGWLEARGYPGRRLPRYGATHSVPKAVCRDRFEAVGGYPDAGYGEDELLGRRIGPAWVVPEARWRVTLPTRTGEIFRKSRWIGRGPRFARDGPALWRLLPPWSWLAAFRLLAVGRPRSAWVRLVHDAGRLVGFLDSRLRPHLRNRA